MGLQDIEPPVKNIRIESDRALGALLQRHSLP
jgi:hypothetical protein